MAWILLCYWYVVVYCTSCIGLLNNSLWLEKVLLLGCVYVVVYRLGVIDLLIVHSVLHGFIVLLVFDNVL